MAIHPQCQAFLDMLAAQGGPPMHLSTPQQLRAQAAPPEIGGPEEPVFRVEDRRIDGPGGPLALRLYTPRDTTPLPAFVYCHGGGFMLGDLAMSDRLCRMLANRSGCTVVSVDYRLAPEHPFPAALDDAYAAASYVSQHAAELGIDPARVAVGGDSAGGNLAAAVALRARDTGGPPLMFQLLVYPLVDMEDDSPSVREFDGYFLSRAAIDFFNRAYVPDAETRRSPYASPARAATLAGLPPAFILSAECDPLRDQGEAYARALEAAGVPVRLTRYAGMIHPFISLAGIVDGARRAIEDAAEALRRATSAG